MLASLERYGMVMLVVGAAVVAGFGLAWVGYKASVRIQVWGEGMNACDDIVRTVTGGADAAIYHDESRRTPPPLAAGAATHLRPAGLK
jgi:hypothetical protein